MTRLVMFSIIIFLALNKLHEEYSCIHFTFNSWFFFLKCKLHSLLLLTFKGKTLSSNDRLPGDALLLLLVMSTTLFKHGFTSYFITSLQQMLMKKPLLFCLCFVLLVMALWECIATWDDHVSKAWARVWKAAIL